MSQFQKGDVVIRAYNHNPEEWGIVVDFEKVIVDPRKQFSHDELIEDEKEFVIEYVYVTVLWPDGYTTQEADYELWTPEEAFKHSEKTLKELEAEKPQQNN